MIVIETERLRLRQWTQADKIPFAKMTADAEVMRYFPSVLTRERSDYIVDVLTAEFNALGYTFFAVDRKDSGEFIGFIGFHHTESALPFAPCDDIGWRLAREHWGNGFATEGALACLEFAFNSIGLEKLVSMTPLSNTPSERVMQKIGMHKLSDTFMHPEVPEGHALCEHVLYELTKDEWQQSL